MGATARLRPGPAAQVAGLDRRRGLGRDAAMDITTLEERVAHLLRAVDDLSEVVARQDREIALLQARVAMLVEREAEREAQAIRDVPIDRPPHW